MKEIVLVVVCRNSNLVVRVVRATEAATIEEAYFWSTTHTETDPVVDSGGETDREKKRRRIRIRRNSSCRSSNSKERGTSKGKTKTMPNYS